MLAARPGSGYRARLRLALAGALTALLAAACSSSGGANSGPAAAVTVAVLGGSGSEVSIAQAPLALGASNGAFSQHGLKVTIRSYATLAQVLAALKSGQAQFAGGDYTGFLYAQSTGAASLRLVADGYDAAPGMLEVLSLQNSPITTPQQLAGQTVATPPTVISYPTGTASSGGPNLPGNIEQLATQAQLENENVSPSTITWRHMPLNAMVPALRHHRVSAILAPEPIILQAQSALGAQVVLDTFSGSTSGLPLAGYFSLASYAQSHRAVVSGFQSGLAQAQNAAATRGPLQNMLPHAAGLTANEAALVTIGSYPSSLSIDQVQRVATLMSNAGMLNNQLNVASLAGR